MAVCVPENFFTYSLNTVYHIMTLIVYKFIMHARKYIFLVSVLLKTLEYKNIFFFDHYYPVA